MRAVRRKPRIRVHNGHWTIGDEFESTLSDWEYKAICWCIERNRIERRI